MNAATTTARHTLIIKGRAENCAMSNVAAARPASRPTPGAGTQHSQRTEVPVLLFERGALLGSSATG
jgi:hypothetical protein